MISKEFKKSLLEKISESEDMILLQRINDLIDIKRSCSVMELSEETIAEIAASKKDIESGSYIEHKLFAKEVKLWLKGR